MHSALVPSKSAQCEPVGHVVFVALLQMSEQ
jgi:hypothetical protein